MLRKETLDSDAAFKYSSVTQAVTGLIVHYTGVCKESSVYGSYRYKRSHLLVLIVANVLETGIGGAFQYEMNGNVASVGYSQSSTAIVID